MPACTERAVSYHGSVEAWNCGAPFAEAAGKLVQISAILIVPQRTSNDAIVPGAISLR
jgi:hypothetical protein